jgi:hypothetical protein
MKHKRVFGQAYCKDPLKKSRKKHILYFLSFIPFSLFFRNLHHFLEILYQKNEILGKRKTLNSVGPLLVWGPAWPARPAQHRNGPRRRCHALGMVTARRARPSTVRRWSNDRVIFTASTRGLRGWCWAWYLWTGLTEAVRQCG